MYCVSLHQQTILPCTAAGQSAKEVPVQKTVPVIGTPADADPDQHEVLEELFPIAGASSLSCLLPTGHEQCGDTLAK